MSVRASNVENDISSILGRSSRPAGWRWWGRRRARQELAVREATELLNEFGKDAYWLACIGARRSRGALRRHWHTVAAEIERRTDRKSPATGKIAARLCAAYHQVFAARSAALPRDTACHAGAPDDLHDEKMCDDKPRKNRRYIFVTALALSGCATVGTAGTYAYWTYYFGPSHTQSSAAPPQAELAPPAVGGALPAAAAKAAVDGYVVQVSARRSKANVQASFRSLQAKFPRQLGSRTAIVQRADLGAKGIYYRAVVGPFASAGEADQFCGSLKAAGGECSIQRN
jgi:hypothetical protein